MMLMPFVAPYLPPAPTYRYFRLDTASINGGAVFQIAELKLFVASTQYPSAIGDMTSNTAPSPLVAALFDEDPASPAWHAFDNNAGTQAGCDSANANVWLDIDLGSGNEIGPTSFKITGGFSVANRSPNTFDLLGSNTGVFSGEEVILKSVSGESGWSLGEERTYTVP